MKPSLLKITGLNSFSQTETIDFGKLTEKGLFGIFGPTGSGKSTVLDAITLALYGDVARKTKSYINSDCDKTNIYFEFFSGHGNHRKKYIIDRTIKRTKTGIQTANVTLEIFPKDSDLREEIIEKRSAVEKELIDNIVKLNFEDFIRTVVLPQGKFSEFLTLTGAERNNMLERILGLEEYGQSLTEKINLKKTQTNSELDKLQGERSRYSESSEEKIKELENIKVNILEEEEALKIEIHELQQDYTKYSAVFKLIEELNIHEINQKKFLDIEAEMIEKEKKFIMARDALHIAPSVDTLDQSIEERTKNTELMQTLDIELIESKQKLNDIEQAYMKAHDIKERDYEKLIEKKSKLDTVIELERDNFESGEILKKETSELVNLKQDINNNSSKLKETENEKVTLEKQIINLEDDIKKKSISSSYRKNLVEGLEIEKSFKQAEKELKEKSEDILEFEERIKNGNEKIIELKIVQDSITDELENKKESFIKLQQILVANELLFERLNSEIDSEKEKFAASRVAVNLKEGCACPVCGSIEHPDIVSDVDQTELNKKEKINKSLESDIRLLHLELALIQSLFKTNKMNLELDLDGIKKENIDVENPLEFKQISDKLKEALEDLNNKRIDLDKKESNYSGLLEKIKEDFKKTQTDYSELEKKLSILKIRYRDVKALLEVEDIKDQYQKVSELEETLEQLNEQLKEKRDKSKEITSFKDKLEKEIQQKQMSFEKLNSCVENRKVQIDKNKFEISKVTDGEDAARLKQSVDNQLNKIVSDEKELRDARENLKDNNTKLTENKLTSINAETKLKNEIDKLREKISLLLVEYKFDSIDIVRNSFLTRNELESLRNLLDKYRSEKDEIKSNITRIQSILKGDTITSDELDKLSTEKTEKETRQKIVLEEKGSLLEKLSEMKKNIERVNEIDKQLKKLEVRKDSLDEIGKMTKGKRFVEFVARNHLKYVARVATEKLKDITRGRFGLVLNSESAFEIVDNYNGGITRDASSLSGGETFLTSLALALALSTKIQLKGNTSMEFFFLDEGFGTLDVETLDTAMTALEKLYTDNLSVGIISHVEEIKNRVPIKLMVSPPVPGVRGSKVEIQRT